MAVKPQPDQYAPPYERKLPAELVGRNADVSWQRHQDELRAQLEATRARIETIEQNMVTTRPWARPRAKQD